MRTLADKLSDAWLYGDLDPQGDWQPLVMQIFDEHYREVYEQQIADAEARAEEYRKKMLRSSREWFEEWQAKQRTYWAEHERCCKRKAPGKRRNVVRFDLKATIAPDATATLEVLRADYGPDAGKLLTATHGQADGQQLWAWITYGPVKGGEMSDVKKVLERCTKKTGATVVGDAAVVVLSREPVEDD